MTDKKDSKNDMFPCESRVTTPEYRENYDNIFGDEIVDMPEVETKILGRDTKHDRGSAK